METKEVLLIHNSFEPYRIPLFNELAKQKGIHLTVLFLSTSRSGQEAYLTYIKAIRFHCVFLSGVGVPLTPTLKYYINLSVVRYLFDPRYDVVILAGWQHFAVQAMAMACMVRRRPYLMWSTSTLNEVSIQRRIARPFVRWIVGHASACIAGGTAAKEYLQTLGVRASDLFIAFNTVDIAYFTQKSTVSLRRRRQIRKRYNVTDSDVVILSVGQFIRRKGIDLLIRTLGDMVRNTKNISLWIIGQGPQQKYYRSIVRDLHLVRRVHIIPYVFNADLAMYYGAADIFVLPSREDTWGLVVNEAMAAGLPVIVSKSAGSAKDLVRDGENGYTLAVEDRTAFGARLMRLVKSVRLRERMGRQSQKKIRQFTAKHSSLAFVQAIHHAAHRI